MSQQAIVEQILTAATEAICTEVGELLGQTLGTGELQFSQIDKSSYFFDLARGKSILTHLSVSGDADGSAYAVMPVSAGIQLGASLIMLPEDSIAELVQTEILKGEEADAYAEIANILTGSLSRTFQERYPKKLHLSKGDSEEVIPTKVDLDSDAPFPASHYLLCSSDLQLEGKSLGPFDLLFPIDLLGLDVEKTASPEPAQEPVQESEAMADSSAEEAASVTADAPETAATTEPVAAPPSAEEIKRNKSIVDLVLKSAIQKIDAELGALMGEFVATADITLSLVSKEGYFFDQPRDTLVFSHLDASGDGSGTAFIVSSLKDAVYLGGKLIMLPDDEIAQQMESNCFDGEPADAFGEIANILTGVICNAFEEKHPDKFHFVRNTIETVVPTKVDVNSDIPFPNQDQYVASCSVVVGEKELGHMEFVFPAAMLGIHAEVADTAAPAAPAATGDQVSAAATGHQAAGTEQVAAGATATAAGVDSIPNDAQRQASLPPALLVISDQPDEAAKYAEALASLGFPCVQKGYQDDLKAPFREHAIQLICLVMSKVNEQGFAAAIKLQSAVHPLPPMVACGPEWTRSAVLRAVRYGVQDILITPAQGAEILAKGQGLIQHKATG